MRFLPCLAALLVVAAHAEARGSGGGGGGVHGAIGFHAGVRVNNFHRIAPRAFPVNRALARANQFRRFNNRFQNGNQIGWWPYGWWPDWSGYPTTQAAAYAPVPQPPADPQVIVIHSDDNGQMKTQEGTQDFSYAGCHPIPNGYHCDTK
jgi:hypothetical protein